MVTIVYTRTADRERSFLAGYGRLCSVKLPKRVRASRFGVCTYANAVKYFRELASLVTL